jgi:hypothetical protein
MLHIILLEKFSGAEFLMETAETVCRDVANIWFGRYIEGKAAKLFVLTLLSVLLDI